MNQKDKKIIEDSEARGIPIFVLTAKDAVTLSTLDKYKALCKAEECPQSHISEIGERIDEFKEWQKNNPGQVKLPD